MKTIFSPVKHSYLAKIGILLIAVALVAGIVSCNGGATYELTIASTAGGVTTPVEGTYTHPARTVVDLVATPDCGHVFVNWSGDTGQIDDVNAAATNITMSADYSITANFEPIPPDHYKFYFAEWQGGEPPEKLPADVQLADQFGAFNATVGDVALFGNPVKKVHGDTTMPISDGDRHYTLYELEYDEGWIPSSFKVTVKNQFQLEAVELTVEGPYFLAVPTRKIEGDHEMPECIDHLLLYMVVHPIEYVPEPIGEVDLYDQFHDELNVTVYEPMFFANPVEKTVLPGGAPTPIEHQDEHYVFYPMDETFEKSGVPITNQFGNQNLTIFDPALLAVPSEKISWEQPLNHFKTYWAEWPLEPPPQWEPPLPVDVQLEDQFVTINATVWEPYLFANPVEKWKMVGKEEVRTPIWDPKDHLTLYYIDSWADPQEWDVEVTNQFGINQVLRVAGPFYLAVPTGKLTPDWPTDVNHYLVYDVYYKEYPMEDICIWDQFIEGETTVYEPYLFAVPAQKTHPPGGPVTPIVGDDHLLFYWIDGIHPLNKYNLPVVNQFGEQYLDVFEDEYNFLGVPSQKVSVEGPYPYEPPF